jgi:integrase
MKFPFGRIKRKGMIPGLKKWTTKCGSGISFVTANITARNDSDMYKPTYTRPIPPNAKTRKTKEGDEVQIRHGGRMVWVPVSKGGRARVEHTDWHGNLKGADGVVRLVRLCSDKEAAAAMLRDKQRTEDRIRAGLEAPAAKTGENVAQLVDRYHAEKLAEGLNPRSLSNLFASLRLAIKFLGLVSIDDVRRLDAGAISRWFVSLKTSPGTNAKKLIRLGQFIRWLHDQKLIAEVPRLPKSSSVITHKRRPLWFEDVEKLAAVATWPRCLFYRLAFATLGRRGAILALTGKDFDFGPGGATVTFRAEHAKTGKAQLVPVPARLVPDIRRRIAETSGGKLFEPLIACNVSGFQVRFHADLKAAGIPQKTEEGKACIHSLRHGGASHLARGGVPLLLLKELGGWSSISIVSKHYAHLCPATDRRLIDLLMAGEN